MSESAGMTWEYGDGVDVFHASQAVKGVVSHPKEHQPYFSAWSEGLWEDAEGDVLHADSRVGAFKTVDEARAYAERNARKTVARCETRQNGQEAQEGGEGWQDRSRSEAEGGCCPLQASGWACDE